MHCSEKHSRSRGATSKRRELLHIRSGIDSFSARLGRKTHPLLVYTNIFDQVKAMLGGEVSMMTCGSAPIDGETLTLMRLTLCCDVIEG